MEFSRPEYWSGQPFPSSVDPPNPGIEPRSYALQEDSLPSEPPGKPFDPRGHLYGPSCSLFGVEKESNEKDPPSKYWRWWGF